MTEAVAARPAHATLETLGIHELNLGGFDGEWLGSGPVLEVFTPTDGSLIGKVQQVTEEEYDRIVDRAHQAFLEWRKVPAPRRGEIVRQIGNALREKKEALGALVTLEMGKIATEGQGSTGWQCTRSARTTGCTSSGIRSESLA